MIKAGLLAVLCASLFSQERISITPRSRNGAVATVRPASLRYDVSLVQIPVTVTDPHGRPLIDLRRDAFRLFEDDVERGITAFSITDAPISATLVFDSSRSMKPRIARARTAVEQLLRTAQPGDEFSLIRFSDRAELLSGFTPDPDAILRSLGMVEARGWTALYDALCLAAQRSHKSHNQRKAVIVFSDGGDNNSRYSESEIISILREADVQVYAISILTQSKSLERFAEETGGSALVVRRMEDLPEAVETLSRQVRSEYLIGYSPGVIQNDGKYHRIRLEVRPPAGVPRVRASWRRGYVAPGG